MRKGSAGRLFAEIDHDDDLSVARPTTHDLGGLLPASIRHF
jgi:hypothetical protein